MLHRTNRRRAPHRLLRIGILGLLLGGTLTKAPAATPLAHSLLIAGPTFTGILDEAGQEVWNAGRPGARDAFLLDNGNPLITWGDVVQEIEQASGKVVFEYKKSDDNEELGTAVRLTDGSTLVTELGKQPRIVEVDARGTVVKTIPLLPETDNAHMQTRMARKLPNGHYLVPHLLAFRVKEYDALGNVVSQIATDLPELGGRATEAWPFTAIRLPHGHTLVTLTHSNQVAEFDAKGQLTWLVTNNDLPGKPLADPCGAQRLPNGNTVICSYAAQQGIKVLEVSPDKQIVWHYDGPHRAHEVQVLTTNGQPLPNPPWK